MKRLATNWIISISNPDKWFVSIVEERIGKKELPAAAIYVTPKNPITNKVMSTHSTIEWEANWFVPWIQFISIATKKATL